MNKEISNDYELEAVPNEHKKSVISIMSVWTGYVFVVTSMMAGGGLTQILPLKDIFLVMLVGNIFLSIIAIGMSYIASTTGLTFALISRHSFGNNGSRLVSFFSPVINIGWYIVNSAVYGSLIANIMGLNETGEVIAMALSALAMGIIAIIGFEALNTLGLVSIPAIIFLCIASAMRATMEVDGGISEMLNYVPKNYGTLADGLMIVIGTWIFSVSTAVADIMRYAKNLKHTVIAAVFSLVFGNSLLISCGAIGAAATNQSDLPVLLISLGLVIPGFILLTANIFTTNGTNLYSNALAFSNVFRSVSRIKIFYAMIFVSMVLVVFRPNRIDVFFTFLNILSIIIPAIPGIIFVDFYYFNKMKYPKLDNVYSGFRWSAICSWLLSIVLVFMIPFGFAPLNGILLGSIIYFILNTIDLNIKRNKQ